MEQWYLDQENKTGRTTHRPCIPFIPVLVKDLFNIQFGLVKKVRSKEDEEQKLLDLGLLEKNCRQIRRVYEAQQRSKLYANTLPKDTDIQSTLRMNIAKFEMNETLRAWSL